MADRDEETDHSIAERIAAFCGLLLTAALLGYIGWQAVSEQRSEPPFIVVDTGPVTPFRDGWVVEVEARNESAATATSVEVEATLTLADAEIVASTDFDYVPGNSSRKGGVFFARDPRLGSLELRALGYARP